MAGSGAQLAAQLPYKKRLLYEALYVVQSS
jgi:hypothetical protein